MNAKNLEKSLVATCNSMKESYRGKVLDDDLLECIVARVSSSILISILNTSAYARKSRPINH